MQLIELKQNDRDAYNQFVAAQPAGSFLQSWEWGAWQERLGREVFRFWLLNDDGAQIGTVQFIKMSLLGSKYYLYSPYGPVISENFQFPISKHLISKFPNAIFFRIEPKAGISPQSTGHNPPATKSVNIQPAKTLVINLEKTESELLAAMHPKTRYNIKVAKKHGLEIKDEFDISIGHGLFFDEALRLLVETSKRQAYQSYSLAYYSKLVDFFALQKSDARAHIYKAIYHNQLLASAIMLDFGKTRTFLFGGSSEENKNVMAPYLLHWQAIMDAKAQNFQLYDWWGAETAKGDTPGFVRFKLGFGGEAKEYSGAYDIVVRPSWYQTYKILRPLNQLKLRFFKI